MFPKPALLLGAALALASAVFAAIRASSDPGQATSAAKVGLAAAAAAALAYERLRRGQGRPVEERWSRRVGVSLGLAAIALYFTPFLYGFVEYYHRHDQYHYYLNAKYFPELGYHNLYRCTLIAQDELGWVREESGVWYDLSAEARHPDRVIRDLGGSNFLVPAATALADPARCKERFTTARWREFKEEIRFFRIKSGRDYSQHMQKDRGFNPPPVWILGARLVAGRGHASTGFLQFLASLDVVYLLATFVALFWAFGWRVFALAAVFWGCEAAADPQAWTGGAFLRQDWFFFTVLALCLARRRWHALAGAALAYAALLRIFPGVLALGWLVQAGAHFLRHRSFSPSHRRVFLGGAAATIALVGASMVTLGPGVYPAFYRTIAAHDRNQMPNHMGLRVLVSHTWGFDVKVDGRWVRTGSDVFGRERSRENNKMLNPDWAGWRGEHYRQRRWVLWLVWLGALALFVPTVGRTRSLWVAQGLSAVWVTLLVQLANYYYSFMICLTPLARARPRLEPLFLGYVLASQAIHLGCHWMDDKYALESALALTVASLALAAFWRSPGSGGGRTRPPGPRAPLAGGGGA